MVLAADDSNYSQMSCYSKRLDWLWAPSCCRGSLTMFWPVAPEHTADSPNCWTYSPMWLWVAGGREPWNALRRLFYWLNSVNPSWLNLSHHRLSLSPPTFPWYCSVRYSNASHLPTAPLVDILIFLPSHWLMASLMSGAFHPPRLMLLILLPLLQTLYLEQVSLILISAESHCPNRSPSKCF